MEYEKSGIRFTVILSLFFLQGCQDYGEKFEIIRTPFIEVNVNDSTFTITDYKLVFLGRTMEFNDEESVYEFYERVVLYGISPAPNFAKIQFTFDIQNVESLVHAYTFSYTHSGGIKEITWTESAGSAEVNSFYSCENGQSDALISITKQSRGERIVSGTFSAVLCNVDATEGTVAVTGEFKDVSYE